MSAKDRQLENTRANFELTISQLQAKLAAKDKELDKCMELIHFERWPTAQAERFLKQQETIAEQKAAIEELEANYFEVEKERLKYKQALSDVKNGKDNPCYIVEQALANKEQ